MVINVNHFVGKQPRVELGLLSAPKTLLTIEFTRVYASHADLPRFAKIVLQMKYEIQLKPPSLRQLLKLCDENPLFFFVWPKDKF